MHFCLQYPEWKAKLSTIRIPKETGEFSDPTSDEAIQRIIFKRNIELIDRCAKIAGGEIWEYLFKSVTTGVSFVHLATVDNIPCSRDYFYDRYHKFWFILSQEKHLL